MRLKESINQNQINLLKAAYGDIKKIDPNSAAVKKLMMVLKKLSKDDLETISKAKINFVSTMAQSILRDSNVSESAEMDNLQKRKNDLLKQVDPLIAKKKKLYSDVDITTPKSSDEKKLDKEIADLFSEINDLVHKIVKLKKSQNEGRNTMKLKSAVTEEIVDVNWNAVQNAIINFLKMNTKILDKKVQAKDTEGVKSGLKSIISGLTNAQRSLKLESVNEASYVSGYTVKAKTPYEFVNGAYAVLSAYLRDEELGPKGKKELQNILKSLEYMRKYFFFKLSESINEAVSKTFKIPTQRGILHLEVEEDPAGIFVDVIFNKVDIATTDIQFPTGEVKITQKQKRVKLTESIKESAKKSTFTKVARISNNGKLHIY